MAFICIIYLFDLSNWGESLEQTADDRMMGKRHRMHALSHKARIADLEQRNEDVKLKCRRKEKMKKNQETNRKENNEILFFY